MLGTGSVARAGRCPACPALWASCTGRFPSARASHLGLNIRGGCSNHTLIGVVADFGAPALNLMCGGSDL
jgi:hypothetical protein